jgi:hypothetical protein
MITLRRNGVNADGTSLQGYIEADYYTLVRLFGSPDPGDEHKTQVEWAFEVYDENIGSVVVTIYDWKQGDCYLGEGNGIPPEAVTTWNVGGYSSAAYHRLNDLLMTVQEMAA